MVLITNDYCICVYRQRMIDTIAALLRSTNVDETRFHRSILIGGTTLDGGFQKSLPPPPLDHIFGSVTGASCVVRESPSGSREARDGGVGREGRGIEQCCRRLITVLIVAADSEVNCTTCTGGWWSMGEQGSRGERANEELFLSVRAKFGRSAQPRPRTSETSANYARNSPGLPYGALTKYLPPTRTPPTALETVCRVRCYLSDRPVF